MSLTAMLLADSGDDKPVRKGGPGSGPRPGQSSKQTVAAEQRNKNGFYHPSEAHKEFAQAHRDMAAKLKEQGDKQGATNHMKAAQAHETASRPHDKGNGEAMAREVHATNSSFFANRGKTPESFHKR